MIFNQQILLATCSSPLSMHWPRYCTVHVHVDLSGRESFVYIYIAVRDPAIKIGGWDCGP